MNHISSNAGHSAKASGASGYGYKEHILARKINAAFASECRKRGCKCSISTSNAGNAGSVLSQQAAKANKSGAQFAVSHHINAGGGTGIEVLYDVGDAVARKYAERVADALSRHYSLPNRGAKARNNLYWLNNTKMPAILIEWGFIDNRSDMAKILGDINGGCGAALSALGIKPKRYYIKFVDKYIPVRNVPRKRSTIAGRIANGANIKLLKRGAIWSRVKRGSVVGYVPSKYIIKR